MARPYHPLMLAEVEDGLGRGEAQGAIVARVAAAWSVESRVVKRYLAEVLRRWGARVVDGSADESRAEVVGMTLNLYAETRRLGHHKSALAALDLLAKLLGLTRADAQVAVNVLDRSGSLTGQDEVRERLAELRLRQLGNGTGGQGEN